MEFLNEYSGLFSLLAVVASVVAIVVPVVIFNKQKKEQEKYYYKQKKDQEYFYLKQQQDHLQDLQDEYEAIESTSMFPMSLAEREYYSRKNYLKNKLGR
ncbi:hypothetical protein [Segatella copri]|uniref:Uncharacterized protein n=1 Tax=Segatella copri TaxID=165179 RepID=A0AA90ZUK1_9BACT|nr:hypothetical protein [Segatella copri]MQN84780.1 hypothetical protein [Segatella copri]